MYHYIPTFYPYRDFKKYGYWLPNANSPSEINVYSGNHTSLKTVTSVTKMGEINMIMPLFQKIEYINQDFLKSKLYMSGDIPADKAAADQWF